MPKHRLLVDEDRNGLYVRAWREGRGRNAVIMVQVWAGPKPDGEPTGDWEMPGVLGVEVAVAQAILQTT